MQTRTRAGSQRPLPATLSTTTTTTTTAPTTAPTRPLSSSALPSPSAARHRPSRTVAPLTEDVFASSLPAAPGVSSLHTPDLSTGHSSHHPSPPSNRATSYVPHMPALSSTTNTPTARPSANSPSQSLPTRTESSTALSPGRLASQANTATTAAVTATTSPSAPPARLRSLSDPTTVWDKGDGDGAGECAGDASSQQSPRQQRPRRHSSGSTSRLPPTLQPSKLGAMAPATFPATSASSVCVLTSPARMASQPDVTALPITSPARRCCLTGGVARDERHSSPSSNGGGSNGGDSIDWKPSAAATTATTTTSALRSRSANVQRGGGDRSAQEARQEPLPIQSPPPPSSGDIAAAVAATTTTTSRRVTHDNGGNLPRHRTLSSEMEAMGNGSGEAFVRENPRVRALVNNLYQHVLTVQPEDPLHYLAHLNPHAVPQPPSVAPCATAQQEAPSESVNNVNREEKDSVECRRTSSRPAPLPSDAGDVVPGSNSHGGTYPPRTRSPEEESAVAATPATTTITDTRLSSDGVEASAPAPPSAEAAPPQDQQPQRPPRSRPGRLVTPLPTHPHSNDNGGGAVAAADVPARGRSSPVQPRQSGRSHLVSELGNANRANASSQSTATTTTIPSSGSNTQDNSTNNNGITTTSSFASPAPALTIDTGSIGSTNSSNNNSRALRAPPPSAPTTSLHTRLASAGSLGHTANFRGTHGSGSKLSSPFYLQRSSFHMGGGLPQHSFGSAAGGPSSYLPLSRAMGLHTSFTGSVSGLERGEATPSDVSSLFSVNSVDLQEFMAEFRLAKEESCGGGIECPLITLDDLATIMETVAFPFPDGAALLDLFEELQPCARYWAKAPSASSPATAIALEGPASAAAATLQPPPSSSTTSTRAPGSNQSRRPPREASSAATVNGPLRGSSTDGNINIISNHNNGGAAAAGVDGAGKFHVGNSGATGTAATAVTATHGSLYDESVLPCGASDSGAATKRHSPRRADAESVSALASPLDRRVGSVGTEDSMDVAVARHCGMEEALPGTTSFDARQTESTVEGDGVSHQSNTTEMADPNITTFSAHPVRESLPKMLVPGRPTTADGYFASTSIPPPPLAKRSLADNDTAAAAAAAMPTVPFETFLARMAFKIQGRYSAEAIRIAFYGMVVDDNEDGEDGEDNATATAVASQVNTPALAEGTSSFAAATTAQGSRGVYDPFFSNSLTPSEPAGGSVTLTALHDANIPSCTVPLLRCIAEGLYARLGMVDATASEVQRGVHSAGLPTAPEDQRACECHLEDFARLVRAVSTVADRGFSVSPGNFCLSSLRDGALPRGPSATASWKEESALASGKVVNAPAAHPTWHT
ncbi:hypothetical protein ABB37_06432 [Leptomonas pyrrhocoris]|uniref:Uncharacterized protein n=1 Tax=Leptomonas pyrrhocoris TaxID=157538 RepID=A0A0N0DU21_LEPPY|nr:hypothetical protein ABB37_06432 [Leptomonas pyrrhocoris]KPA78291.1 hypothetical protein ABB37_06432 [Leptomonas pyrrhocoris]|eukprot:XP_015656730.1 hypothetical protein ABB37_06432 [Leptomonas pyrrhocoris]